MSDKLDDHIIRMTEQLGRMEGKIDATMPVITDHESRIRKLERYKWLQLGGAGVIGTVAGYLTKMGGTPPA